MSQPVTSQYCAPIPDLQALVVPELRSPSALIAVHRTPDASETLVLIRMWISTRELVEEIMGKLTDTEYAIYCQAAGIPPGVHPLEMYHPDLRAVQALVPSQIALAA
ncbi:hypothetical protein [Marinactinospora rubrisoli]|uniref:Uncharacterized protein n=1 Tax=Marinactinospora rubrisoli TaxID=2715399 RepID=A0ABW2KL77_9ACTN